MNTHPKNPHGFSNSINAKVKKEGPADTGPSKLP
jgi:hypothetical protein